MKRPTVALFDIDGTLVKSDGVGRRSINRAFQSAFGRADACDGFRFDGLTDRLIARRGLEAIGEPVTEDNVARVFSAYLEALADEVGRAGSGSYSLHPGVERLIEQAKSAALAVGLGTGNIVEGARIKLEKFGLYRHFEFGGFGSDAELRVDLIRRGAERGAAKLGVSLGECRVVIVGDTPHDVQAALGIGAECLAVGTGRYSAQELLAHGATFAVDTLDRPEAAAALLGEH